MEGATNFEGKEKLNHPENQIYAILDDSVRSSAAISALNRAGFSEDMIGILSGPADASKLDAVSGKEGFFAKLFSIGVEMGDRDADYLQFYRKALMQGKSVIAVIAADDATRGKVHELLKAQGAHGMTLFGQFVVEALEG
ncbi:MAG: hypothetical protein JOY96_05840 [Verrucomicrobia bacterium]|nr:hypothetical protein [Verrucomicrobiota bacterium]MBV9673001.1 hypothetical protein [Verrucomicrobiota bacterium]